MSFALTRRRRRCSQQLRTTPRRLAYFSSIITARRRALYNISAPYSLRRVGIVVVVVVGVANDDARVNLAQHCSRIRVKSSKNELLKKHT